MRIVTILVTVATLSAYVTVMPAYAGQHGRPVVNSAPHANPAPRGTTGDHAPAGPGATEQARPIPPQLASRLQPLLPKGMMVQQAAAGFRNHGQFIAALHVSRNLNIPFAQLKAEMTGTHPVSLGRAIHDLRPAEDARAAASQATREARRDLDAAGSDGDHNGHR